MGQCCICSKRIPGGDKHAWCGRCAESALESDKFSADKYGDELDRCQVALDMRCVDDPSRVGCTDLIFEVANTIPRVIAIAVAAERERAARVAEDIEEDAGCGTPITAAIRGLGDEKGRK